MSFSSNFSEAAERNKEPILSVLLKYISESNPINLLEIASGTGQHASHFAPKLSNVQFFPSDLTDEMFHSISERCNGLNNVNTPRLIDISCEIEDCEGMKHLLDQNISIQAILTINLLHISPWRCTIMLMKNSSRLLESGGLLFVYGPFNINHEFTSEGNKNFDEHLKGRNAEWAIRDMGDVEQEANKNGLTLIDKVAMPANNFTLVFKKL